MRSVLGGISLVLVALGLVTAASLWISGIREMRRFNATPVPDEPTDPYEVIAMIACLDEELVIGATVQRLLSETNARVFVIDDASTDQTEAAVIAAAASIPGGSERVQVVRRFLPEARKGKGEALNYGYLDVCRYVRDSGLNPGRVIIVVMDADGRLSDGAVPKVCALFDDETIGGAQLGVRIRNSGSLLTRLQDFEFWGISAFAQVGRRGTRTVSLGGNGQFTRLSALLGLARLPWSFSLTEDLDLAISLLAKGWGLTTRPDAYVDQQGLTSLGRLIRQRTRWFQGHMSCCRRLPEIWAARHLGTASMLEVTCYLLTPFIMVLPWSLVFPIALIDSFERMTGTPPPLVPNSPAMSRLLVIAIIYFLSFTPMLIAAFAYRRRQPDVTRLFAFVLAHTLVLYNVVAFIATWKGLIRLLRGQTGWDKTVRLPEQPVLESM